MGRPSRENGCSVTSRRSASPAQDRCPAAPSTSSADERASVHASPRSHSVRCDVVRSTCYRVAAIGARSGSNRRPRWLSPWPAEAVDVLPARGIDERFSITAACLRLKCTGSPGRRRTSNITNRRWTEHARRPTRPSSLPPLRTEYVGPIEMWPVPRGEAHDSERRRRRHHSGWSW